MHFKTFAFPIMLGLGALVRAVLLLGAWGTCPNNCLPLSNVTVACKVSSHWILETIDFNRHYCFSIVEGFR